MNSVEKTVKNSLKKKKGQTSVEYILLIALVVGVVLLFGGKMKDGIKRFTGSLFGKVDSSIGKLAN